MVKKRVERFIIILAFTCAIACCSHRSDRSALANPSPVSYLAQLADRASTQTNGNQLGFLVSFETTDSPSDFNRVLANVAFTYDNAIAAIALVAAGDRDRAQQIVDTLVYAQNHDRFYQDGRLRNAYRGGKLTQEGKLQLPGWWDKPTNRWAEDEFQIATHAGNLAWAMLALLTYYETYGGDRYLVAAQKLGEWVEQNCRDSRGAGGYSGGFTGWESNPTRLTYKSTEHNIDLYAAFSRLYRISGNLVWQKRAIAAQNFVLAMWDPREGKFWTGTQPDGVSINPEVVPLDVQAWAVLALREAGKPYWRSLDYAEAHHKVGKGFDFNQDSDAIWYEGTAQMAAAYHLIGEMKKSEALLATLNAARYPSGGIPASDRDGLTTGFALTTGKPWLYFNRPHVGATAWFAIAHKGINPFWLGSRD